MTGALLRATVDTRTGAVSFANSQGTPLLSELARKFSQPAQNRAVDGFQVEQTFACRPDETLLGLGQRQDGVWNLRGIPVDLRQHNPNVAVPVLVSTAGYGILWDDAARTQFNPVDAPIAMTLEPPADGKNGPPPLAIRHGTFTTGPAGEYVFFMQNGYWGKYGWSAPRFDETYYPDPPEMIKQLHDEHFTSCFLSGRIPAVRSGTPSRRFPTARSATAPVTIRRTSRHEAFAGMF